MQDLEGLIETAVHAARSSGSIIMKNLGRLVQGDIDLKMPSDFVTRVDMESEKNIVDTIKERHPSHSIMAEESQGFTQSDDYVWIIDPLDGTTNYIHSYPMFGISIAVKRKDNVVAAVVYDPLRDELFSATNGGGAMLNNKPIRVSEHGDMGRCLIATGFPFRQKHMLEHYLRAFKLIFLQVSGIRRAGAAALDLAYLAAGRCDGFFELGLQAWDIAAGSLLITEAGGLITDFGGGSDFLKTGNVVAGNPAVHEKLLDSVREVFSGTINS